MFNTREKQERSLGVKLFLKPHRCGSPKCVLVRRPNRPGLHSKARRVLSEYGQQLKEKQKIRATYGIRERQMGNLFTEASKNPGATGEMIMMFLERRLDNVVHRLGFAPSRSVARQLVGHGHILVNKRRTTIPSYRIKLHDVVSIRPESATNKQFQDLPAQIKNIQMPVWLRLDPNKLEGEVIDRPKDFDIPFDLSLVVDYYSK